MIKKEIPYPKISKSIAQTGDNFPEFLDKSFARVLERIEFLWGEKEANDYFDSLLLGDDPNDKRTLMHRSDISDDTSSSIRKPVRQGFPLEAVKEIAQLKHIHDILYPWANPLDNFYGSLKR